MTDWYQTLFAQDAPWAPRRGVRRTNPDQNAPQPGDEGLRIGSMVGRMLAPTTRHPETPGPSSFTERDFAQADAMINVQRRFAERPTSVDRGPRLPVMAGEQTAEVFPMSGVFDVIGERPSARAARAVGVPAEYVDALVGHESGGDPNARNPQSTATGHGQFIERTWLNLMNTYGPRYGFGQNGTANLSKEQILDLRRDPQWSAIMTAEYGRENAAAVSRALNNRPLSEGEVYLAHFLGPKDAISLIDAADEDRRRGGRGRPATQFVEPSAVESNRSIFFDANGRPRTAQEVHALQTRNFRERPFTMRDRAF